MLKNMPFIDISLWKALDEAGFPPGARDKEIFISPNEVDNYNELKPNHPYMFKESIMSKKGTEKYPWQFWMEIIAFHVGQLVGVDVPTTFPAFRIIDEKTVYGALIEWFIPIPFANKVLIHGHEFLKELHEDYDLKQGKKHNFQDVAGIFNSLSNLYPENMENWVEYWTKILCFDVLIGNTDRHHGNWGVIYCLRSDIPFQFTPAFDNGTSLGHEKIERKFEDINIEQYINKGQHHMKWCRNDDFSKVRGEKHIEMLKKLVTKYQKTRNIILEMLLDDDTIEVLSRILKKYSEYNINGNAVLTKNRCEFIIELVRQRNESIYNAIK